MSVRNSLRDRLARAEDPTWRALVALAPDPRRSVLAVLAGTAALGAAIGLMAVSGWLVSRAAQRPEIGVLSVAVVATRALGIGRGVLRYVERLVGHDVALRGVAAVRERLYTRLAEAEPATVAGLRRGDLLARVGADVDALSDLVVRSLLPFATAWTVAVVTVAGVALLLPSAALALAAGLLVACVVAPWLTALAARRAETRAAAARAAMGAQTLALLDGLAELTVAGAVPGHLARVDATDADLGARLDDAARPAGWAAGLVTAAMGAATLACLVLGARAVEDGRLAEVALAVVVLVPMAATEAALALPAAAAGFVRARTSAVRVMELLDAPPAAAARAGTVPVPDGPLAVTARGLACGWPGRPPALAGVDFDLTPGRTVAVVGPSGGGKTTLLLTLAGLLPPVAGTVAAGGVPVDRLEPVALRRAVSFTAEDAHVFATTVRENLRVARGDATDAEIAAAVDGAGLTAWLAGLPDGLDTLLGAGGADVSGGERRRLLLARALLVGARVLLLDEPGEHLDAATADGLLADVLRGGGPDAPAVVVVTHRVTPLAAADEVLVVDDGAVTARGRHVDLLRTVPTYADAWRAEGCGTLEAGAAVDTTADAALEEAGRG